jgi:hypothetical protein
VGRLLVLLLTRYPAEPVVRKIGVHRDGGMSDVSGRLGEGQPRPAPVARAHWKELTMHSGTGPEGAVPIVLYESDKQLGFSEKQLAGHNLQRGPRAIPCWSGGARSGKNFLCAAGDRYRAEETILR